MSESQDAYKTIKGTAEGEFKDRGSKFIAYVNYIETEEDFNHHVSEIKSLHLKARHHCYAYRFLDTNQFRYNDDGEPSGTAGKPIYNQLLSFDVVNVSCIVVRYFGGTKLGTSGLINAYRESAKLALQNAGIEKRFITAQFKIQFDYALMGTLMDVIKNAKINIDEKNFEGAPFFTLSANASEVPDKILLIKAKMLDRPIKDVDEETEVEGIKFIE